MATRLFLRGDADAVAELLDELNHVASLRGAVEHDGEVDVYVDGDLERLPSWPGVEVRRAPVESGVWTGFEADRVIRVAPDLVVRPPWVPPLAGFGGIDLVVPRGMAFGSGEHGSTRAALMALHALWRDPVESLIDVGTGSGVLALYGRERAAREIHACDVDPAAARAASALLPSVDVRIGDQRMLAGLRADVVVANLDGDELAVALPAIVALWNRRIALVVAGLRDDREARVRSELPAPVTARFECEGFVALGLGPVHPRGV